MAMVKKVFDVVGTHHYQVHLEYDDEEYNGKELAVAAVQYIDLENSAIKDKGDEDLEAVWDEVIQPYDQTACLTPEQIIAAGADEDELLVEDDEFAQDALMNQWVNAGGPDTLTQAIEAARDRRDYPEVSRLETIRAMRDNEPLDEEDE